MYEPQSESLIYLRKGYVTSKFNLYIGTHTKQANVNLGAWG